MEQAILFLVEKEKVFKDLYEKYGDPYIPSRPQGFETVCKLILEQQVSIDSARACFQKIEQLLGTISPHTVAQCSDENLKRCGVSRQKTEYLKIFSKAVIDGLDLESLASKSAEDVRSELIKIKGIGHWTIDVYLMFALQAPDIIPLGDVAVINTIKELFDIHTKEEMLARSENWKPYKTMATFMLWHHYLEKRNRKPIV